LFAIQAPCLLSNVYKTYNATSKEVYEGAEIAGIHIRNSSNFKGEKVTESAKLGAGEYILDLKSKNLIFFKI